MNELADARRDLAAALRWADRLGLSEGIHNHFSYALDEDRILVNPYGLHWSEITASSLPLVDGAGRVVDGHGNVEDTALFIHGQIHRTCPHARCVLHTHMPYATALTLVEGGRLEPCEQNALRYYDRIAYDDDYTGLALDEAEGARIAAKLGNKSVLFMASHGVVASGATIACAFDDLYYLERAAKVQVLARSTGLPLRRVSEDVARKTAAQFVQDGVNGSDLHFAARKRILDREEPDYAN